MALVSGGRSTLNPDAPLFIPSAVRQVEDFSPEWYDLISTSTWFRDYWLSQNQEADMFYNHEEYSLDNSDIVNFLPDEIDLGMEEDMSYMESQFQELSQSQGHLENKNISPKDDGDSKDFGSLAKSFPVGSKFAAQPAKVPSKGN